MRQTEEFAKGASSVIKDVMQTIYPTSLTPEQYAQQKYHQQVRPPENCPNCQRAHVLEALAYYERFITTATALVLLIWVRRFLCRVCRVSVSCLPSFAQPYRPVHGELAFKRRWAVQTTRGNGFANGNFPGRLHEGLGRPLSLRACRRIALDACAPHCSSS